MNTLKVSVEQAERFLKEGVLEVEKQEGEFYIEADDVVVRKIGEPYQGSHGTECETEDILELNEPVQLVSESNEKYWYCPKCKSIVRFGAKTSDAQPFQCKCITHYLTGLELVQDNLEEILERAFKNMEWKPFVLVPSKIEDAGKNWKITGEVE